MSAPGKQRRSDNPRNESGKEWMQPPGNSAHTFCHGTQPHRPSAEKERRSTAAIAADKGMSRYARQVGSSIFGRAKAGCGTDKCMNDKCAHDGCEQHGP